MKKIIIFLIMVIIVVCGVFYMYVNYKATNQLTKNENKQYEQYIGKEIYGTELVSIMNKAMDSNYKNELEKDNNGKYIENNTNSIQIQIKMIDNDKTYEMETFSEAGMDKFIYYYSMIKFKGMKIEYHKTTQKVKYMLFEQITK